MKGADLDFIELTERYVASGTRRVIRLWCASVGRYSVFCHPVYLAAFDVCQSSRVHCRSLLYSGEATIESVREFSAGEA